MKYGTYRVCLQGSLDKTIDENEATVLQLKADHDEEKEKLKSTHSTEVDDLKSTFQVEIEVFITSISIM